MSTLAIARFLLHRGVISEQQHAELARARQARNRALGEIAVAAGILSLEQVEAIVALQETSDIYFGEAAVQMGVLTSPQVRELLEEQRRTRLVVEDFVVEEGFACRDAVAKALADYNAEATKQASQRVGIRWDAPHAWLAADLFDMTVKLLYRVWALESEPAGAATRDGKVHLPDYRAEIGLSDEFHLRFLIGAPDDVATHGVRRMLRTTRVAEGERQDGTQELANLICGNTSGRLARQGASIALSAPTVAPAEVAAGEAASSVLLATNLGDVVCALVD